MAFKIDVAVGVVFLVSFGEASAVLYGPLVEGSACSFNGERQGVWELYLRYYECEKNRWVKYECPPFSCFNNETMKCERFDHCSAIISQKKNCPPCQKFEKKDVICEWVGEIPCSNDVIDPPLSILPVIKSSPVSASVLRLTAAPTATRVKSTKSASATASPTNIRTTTCTARSRRALIEDCKSYLECDAIGSKWIKQKCSKIFSIQKKFDSRSLSCKVFNYKCFSDTAIVTPTTPPTTAAPATASPTNIPSTTCTAGSRRALIGDCKSYLKCDATGSRWIKKNCLDILFFIQTMFDSRSLSCKLFNYKCLSDATTVHPITALITAAPPTLPPSTPYPSTPSQSTPSPTTQPSSSLPTSSPTRPSSTHTPQPPTTPTPSILDTSTPVSTSATPSTRAAPPTLPPSTPPPTTPSQSAPPLTTQALHQRAYQLGPPRVIPLNHLQLQLQAF